ncbi:MAG: VOC family protein [Polyangiales bacterium]
MSYDHGRFVWFELLTQETEKAVAFYSESLPWKVQPTPMQDGSTYSMVSVGEAGVAGFMTPQAEIPAAWVSYVSVDDVDATAAKLTAAGGAVHGDAFDVPGVGRIQPASDPHGGAFSLFKAETGDPPAAEGPGAFHWNELWTQDPRASLAFYEKVLGYTHTEMEMPNGTYYVLMNGEQARGGMLKAPSSDIPTMWLQYVAVEDCDAALERAKHQGATVVAEPVDAEGVGRFGIIRDPVGGMIGLIKPAAA